MRSFYTGDIGLKVIRNEQEYTALGTESTTEPILILHNDNKASNPPPSATGLYHYALLVPDRASLATAYVSLGRKGIVFDGYADHQVSEALYLTDPDGNGIEIYSDRPTSEWKFDEEGVQMTTQPLNIDSLLEELPHDGKEQKALANGTRVGHMHLKVSDIQTSTAFYRDGVGLDVMRYWGSAAFLSAGGYHHHVGINNWESLGGPAARETWIGLEYFAVRIPETNLNELSSHLGTAVGRHDSKQLFVSDPDDICLIFRAY
jgi:catechol 2,3-dioxygenase